MTTSVRIAASQPKETSASTGMDLVTVPWFRFATIAAKVRSHHVPKSGDAYRKTQNRVCSDSPGVGAGGKWVMGGGDTCKRIVRTFYNHNTPTGEALVQTEDGRIWHVDQNNQVENNYRYRRNGNHICPDGTEPHGK